MGAALGCYSGPEASADWDALLATHALHGGGVHGKQRQLLMDSDAADAGVLGKLQRTLSRSLLRGRGAEAASGAKDDDNGELARSWSQSYSSSSGTTGSRMLSDFYNLVLESERNTCFKDKHGKRVTGAYLDEVPIIEDYFGPSSRKRQRPLPPTAPQHHKLPTIDRFAHLPPALMSTTSTISSEMDYWSCFDSLAMDHDELLDKAPRRYDASSAAMNGLLLFSPMHSGDAATQQLSRSLSPHPRWASFSGGVQFYEANDDSDDDDEDVSSRSAYAYTSDQLKRADARRYPPYQKHHLKQLEVMPLSPFTTVATHSSRPPIYFTPDAARNADAVAPMMAS